VAASILWSISILLVALASKPLPPGAGPANPFQDFGPLTGLVLALDVINTVFVLFYVLRIWLRRA
jgi:hypothetical protein